MRNRSGSRVYGPYRERAGWRIVVVQSGARASEVYENEADAIERANQIRRIAEEEVHITEALAEFERYLTSTRVKSVTVYTNMRRLKTMFWTYSDSIQRLTRSRARRLYQRMCESLDDEGQPRYSVDYHRNSLSTAKRFGAWCVKQGWLRANPFKEVEGVGRRKRGKEQLTADEARRLVRFACAIADRDEGALATLLALLLGLRAGEVAGLLIRDIDQGGSVLHVRGTKTAKAVRVVRVPDVLRDPLLVRCQEQKVESSMGQRLIGLTRYGVHYHVKRMCRLAGVPEVTPHGLRGTHATLATEAGATGDLVMRQLGHTSLAVGQRHYIAEGATKAAQGRAALAVLQGGRS